MTMRLFSFTLLSFEQEHYFAVGRTILDFLICVNGLGQFIDGCNLWGPEGTVIEGGCELVKDASAGNCVQAA